MILLIYFTCVGFLNTQPTPRYILHMYVHWNTKKIVRHQMDRCAVWKGLVNSLIKCDKPDVCCASEGELWVVHGLKGLWTTLLPRKLKASPTSCVLTHSCVPLHVLCYMSTYGKRGYPD